MFFDRRTDEADPHHGYFMDLGTATAHRSRWFRVLLWLGALLVLVVLALLATQDVKIDTVDDFRREASAVPDNEEQPTPGVGFVGAICVAIGLVVFARRRSTRV